MKVNRLRLQQLRMDAGMSLRQLAQAAGIANDTMYDMESGERTPRPASLKKVADVLGVSVGELIDWPAAEAELEAADTGKAAPLAA